MVFSSLEFLFWFLPVFLGLYFLSPRGLKNFVLLMGSLFFYGYGVKDHPVYLVFILLSIAVNYQAGIGMGNTNNPHKRKMYLTIGLSYNIGLLAIFKYLDFFSGNINGMLQVFGISFSIPYLNLVLPIGISFYTFQISSYLIDVYRKNVRPERSIIALGTYLCMFPQLIAGPIVTYTSVAKQLRYRTHSLQKFDEGLRIFTVGLGLKVLIANQVGNLWKQAGTIGFESISTPMAWLGIVAFTFQIYFDFYGYSLMAKGLGRILGFEFPDNFRQPYQSVTVTEFWRRWHMTLGGWFREYVYIPLGGNRKGTARMIWNLLVVWLLTGLWHGASWNFVLWGFLIFVAITIEKLFLGSFLEKHRVLGHLYMGIWIPLTWLLFAVEDLSLVWIYLQKMFPFLGQAGASVFAGDYLKYGKMYAFSLLLGVLFCGTLPEKICRRKNGNFILSLCLTAVFWACVYCMYLGLDDPFLYFNF